MRKLSESLGNLQMILSNLGRIHFHDSEQAGPDLPVWDKPNTLIRLDKPFEDTHKFLELTGT